MENPNWKSDFDKCKTIADYETYIRKYNNDPSNTYLDKAKAKLVEAVKDKASRPSTVILSLLFGLVLFAVAYGLFVFAMSGDGTPDTTTYHGEHVDVKMNNPMALIYIASAIGALVAAGAGLYFIGVSIYTATKKY